MELLEAEQATGTAVRYGDDTHSSNPSVARVRSCDSRAENVVTAATAACASGEADAAFAVSSGTASVCRKGSNSVM